MEGGLEIYVPRAFPKQGSSIFSTTFTVTPTQLYEIRVKLSQTNEIVSFKRYSELLHLSEKVL